ncbi:unnamed protein product [Bursaphelenchus okinawaensis]|uniref:Uncharacterized protein n=1 Tax=Bursaphelenchus okinawaensis TaxID=465554 RepID=A0A811JRE6_9BILA|nr:unnamed protein product [Bursaphelenchus okinawaensis]CAG9078857.1 unnamed protein product [Bursaphelenchus okinawaensis]
MRPVGCLFLLPTVIFAWPRGVSLPAALTTTILGFGSVFGQDGGDSTTTIETTIVTHDTTTYTDNTTVPVDNTTALDSNTTTVSTNTTEISTTAMTSTVTPSTTEVPYSTTEEPHSTTEEPHSTTEEPYSTSSDHSISPNWTLPPVPTALVYDAELHHGLVLGLFIVGTLLGATNLVMAWLLVVEFHLKHLQMLQMVRHKLEVAERILFERALSDEILGLLQDIGFDANKYEPQLLTHMQVVDSEQQKPDSMAQTRNQSTNQTTGAPSTGMNG